MVRGPSSSAHSSLAGPIIFITINSLVLHHQLYLLSMLSLSRFSSPTAQHHHHRPIFFLPFSSRRPCSPPSFFLLPYRDHHLIINIIAIIIRSLFLLLLPHLLPLIISAYCCVSRLQHHLPLFCFGQFMLLLLYVVAVLPGRHPRKKLTASSRKPGPINFVSSPLPSAIVVLWLLLWLFCYYCLFPSSKGSSSSCHLPRLNSFILP